MQIPYVAPIEDFTDLLNILGSKTKYGERLTALHAQQEMLNRSLDRHKDIADIEQTRQQAAGLLSDARGVKADADKYSTNVKGDADKEAQGILSAAQNKLAESAVREKVVEEREGKVGIRESAVNAKEKEIAGREKQVDSELERAATLARQAQALQDKFTAKLGALQAVAVE